MNPKGRGGSRYRNINLGGAVITLEPLPALITYDSVESETKEQGRSH